MVFNHGGNGSRTFVQLGSEPRPVPWQTMATAVVGCVNRAAPGQFQGGAKLKAELDSRRRQRRGTRGRNV
jgi:hypothetical protein